MASAIKCPLCGTENPPDQTVCVRCQTPLTLDASFQPGQAPKRKDTGELEPLLPQWLRDARESARGPADETPAQTPQPTVPSSSASGLDLLAGLQSQTGDDAEEEVPDWLASITGAPTAKPTKAKTEEPEPTSGIRWVETGKQDDFQNSADDDMPPWLAGMQQAPAVGDEKDELTDWFRQSDSKPAQDFQPFTAEPAAAFSEEPQPASYNDTPDWLKQMASDAGEVKPQPPETSFDSSEWFTQPVDSSQPASSSETPDWLSQLQADASAAEAKPVANEPEWASQLQSDMPEAGPAFTNDTPDWLRQLQSDAAPAETPAAASSIGDTPDWLSALGAASLPFAESAPVESEPLPSTGETPAWLEPESPASEKKDSTPVWLQGQNDAATPDWLDDATTPPTPQAGAADAFDDLPDWLKSAAPHSLFDEPAKTVEMPLPQAEPPKPAPFESTPAFAADTLSENDAALFTEMPDWLSNAMEQPPAASMVPEPITGSDALAPDVLPSWVEAMRPSDPGMANIVASANELTLESRGALAGLSGVLPAGAGFAPTSKPKAYSIKLSSSEEQLKHAAILEQILEAETSPVSIASEKKLGASRGLRWTIAALLLTVAFATTFLRSTFMSMPTGVPNELAFAVSVAQAVPGNAPVLVAVDYEAARAGEMEAAAAPLFDNMILLKQPRMTFVASNPSGGLLAERLMRGPLAFHLNNGFTYLNLGYLSGGQMGIRAFAQNPVAVTALDVNGQPAWSSSYLQGVTSLNQFAAILLLTDNADSARAWIEQTQAARGVVPVIVVSSAQAAPMIQPYYDSGQVAGIVSGLYGGAIVESQYNGNRPGTARVYWDAYSISMLLAVVFVLGGGLLNFGLGLRDLSTPQGGK